MRRLLRRDQRTAELLARSDASARSAHEVQVRGVIHDGQRRVEREGDLLIR
jgi:hypothetical protein